MNTKDTYTLSSGQEATPLTLVQIAENYKPTTVFIEEVTIESLADDDGYDPAKLHMSTKKQSNHIHSVEKEALAHWVE